MEPKIHYRTFVKSPTMERILSQTHPAHILPPHYSRTQLTVIPKSKPKSSKCPLLFSPSNKILYAFLVFPIRDTFPACHPL